MGGNTQVLQNEFVMRMLATGLAMVVGYFIAKQLEERTSFITKYIDIVKEKKSNLQTHGLILSFLMVIVVSIISSILKLGTVVEATIIGLMLGPFYVYFVTIQKIAMADQEKAKSKGKKKR